MYDLPPNTVLSHTNLPFQQVQDLSTVPLKKFATHINRFLGTTKHYPETDVLKFYFLNHAFLNISAKYSPLEPLPKEMQEFLEYRASVIPEICSRVLCHTFLTLLYEMNWLHPQVSDKNDKFVVDITNRFGKTLADHFTQGGSGGFQLGKMKNFQNLDTTCGEYTRALFNVYTTSNHFSYIAKDKQWIAIATVPYEYFMGQTSPEGVCDKAFSLFHWGGSIFNKDILYHVNTNEMLNLLDVQDSGQIPQWINENKKSRFVDKELSDMFNKFASVFPEELKTKLDLKKVAEAKSKRSQKLQKVIGQRGGGGGNWAQQQARQQQAPPQAADLLSQQMDVLGINLGKKF